LDPTVLNIFWVWITQRRGWVAPTVLGILLFVYDRGKAAAATVLGILLYAWLALPQGLGLPVEGCGGGWGVQKVVHIMFWMEAKLCWINKGNGSTFAVLALAH
jgi:hypothetical protein